MQPPLEVFLSITTKCNLKCKHCYSNSGVCGRTAEISKIIGVLNEIRPLRLVISGGEPILELVKIINLLKVCKSEYSVNPYVVLATNGTLLTVENLKKIKPYVDRLQISLDSLNPQTFEKIRGVPLLKQTLAGIRLAKSKNFDIQIAFSIFKENIHDIESVVDFCINSGIDKINILRQRPSGRSNPKVSRKEIFDFYKNLLDYTAGKSLKVNIHDPVANKILVKKSECNAGKEIIAVDVDGNFKPCPLLNNGVCGKFRDVWNSSSLFREFRKPASQCANCSEYNICRGGCKVDSFNIGGSVARDPWCMKSL